jgi:hypothetical protein
MATGGDRRGLQVQTPGNPTRGDEQILMSPRSGYAGGGFARDDGGRESGAQVALDVSLRRRPVVVLSATHAMEPPERSLSCPG